MHQHDYISSVTSRKPVSVYETKIVTVPRTTSRRELRQLLTEEAEYGKWELSRLRLYAGGERKVWLRRRIIRVKPTLGHTLPPV